MVCQVGEAVPPSLAARLGLGVRLRLLLLELTELVQKAHERSWLGWLGEHMTRSLLLMVRISGLLLLLMVGSLLMNVVVNLRRNVLLILLILLLLLGIFLLISLVTPSIIVVVSSIVLLLIPLVSALLISTSIPRLLITSTAS